MAKRLGSCALAMVNKPVSTYKYEKNDGQRYAGRHHLGAMFHGPVHCISRTGRKSVLLKFLTGVTHCGPYGMEGKYSGKLEFTSLKTAASNNLPR
jgi:hypothetical protein